MGKARILGNIGTNAGNLATTATGIDVTGTVSADVVSSTTLTSDVITADQFNSNEALPTIKPSLLLDFANSKTLDPRITFTRGSTATYWDGHTTVKAEENLFIYSQDVESWPRGSGATITANVGVAPDGTTTADRILAASGWYRAYLTSLVAGQVYTLSVYIKSNTGSNQTLVLFRENNSASPTVTATTSWQRFQYTFTVSSAASSDYGLWNASSGNDILVWGMQLEQRGSATAYTPTTSSPVVKYQPALQTASPNGARFDHDPVTGESKGLLIEEARTNLIVCSSPEDTDTFGSNGWQDYYGFRADRNSAIAPDGTQTAATVTSFAGGSGVTGASMYVNNPITVSAAPYTFSAYMKIGSVQGFSTPTMTISNTGNASNVYDTKFDLVNGTINTNLNGTAKIEAVGNGWYLCSVTVTLTAGGKYPQVGSYGNAAAGSSFFMWGAQLELGSFRTSYIPTAGSTVTRSADAAELPSNTWYSDSGTLYADFNIAGPATGSYGNVVQLLENLGSRWGFPYTNGNNTLAALAYNAPDLTNATLGGLSYGSNTRVVMTSPNGSQFVTSFNGASVVTTSATAVSNPTSLSIGKVLSDNNTFTGTFSKIAYYPQRLPNATLQAMTEE